MTAPREKRYIAAADLLRVLCIALLAWFHIWQQSWLNPSFTVGGTYINLERIVRRGYMAVDLILLLSGFLLYLPYAERHRSGKPPLPLREFYAARFRRIVPSYLAAVLLALVNTLLCGRAPGSLPLWKDLLAHLTFTHTFWRGSYMWTSLNVVLWTLAVEVQFYLVFPLLAKLFSRKPWLTWAGMVSLALLCRAVLLLSGVEVDIYFNQLPCVLDLYAFGMLAAHRLTEKERPTPAAVSILLSLLALGLIGWVIAQQNGFDTAAINRGQILWRLPLAVLGAVFLYFGAQWPAAVNRDVGWPLMRFFAGISYNFYIWHQYLAVKLKAWQLPPFVTEMPQRDEGLLWQRKYTALCFLAAFLAAVLGTYLIEKPCAKALKKRRIP